MSSKDIAKPASVRLFVGVTYSEGNISSLDKALEIMKKKYGLIISESPAYDFSSITHYYDTEQGMMLKKKIFVFRKQIKPDDIVSIKLFTNTIEDKLSKDNKRNINIDPGYFSVYHLVLVTTKNFSHRIYLKKGIYAELTLLFGKDYVKAFDWTYPDFRLESVKQFFFVERKRLLNEHKILDAKQKMRHQK